MLAATLNAIMTKNMKTSGNQVPVKNNNAKPTNIPKNNIPPTIDFKVFPTKSIPNTPARAPGTLFFNSLRSFAASVIVFSVTIDAGSKKFPIKSQPSSIIFDNPAKIILKKIPTPELLLFFNCLEKCVSKMSNAPNAKISPLFAFALLIPSA